MKLLYIILIIIFVLSLIGAFFYPSQKSEIMETETIDERFGLAKSDTGFTLHHIRINQSSVDLLIWNEKDSIFIIINGRLQKQKPHEKRRTRGPVPNV